MKLRFVTGNPGKLAEARAVLAPHGITVVGAKAAVLEPQADSLDEIATHKARGVLGRVAPPYFLEDAGLFVPALNGFPGPYSAYAYRSIGCEGLLRLLRGRPGPARAAYFEAVVAYVDARRRLHRFRGRVRGHIATRARGAWGFGFDPVFVPAGHRATFAELGPDVKNTISHRTRALQALARHLAATARVNKKG